MIHPRPRNERPVKAYSHVVHTSCNHPNSDRISTLVRCQLVKPRATASNKVMRGCSESHNRGGGGNFQSSSRKILARTDTVSYVFSHWRLWNVLTNSSCPIRQIAIERVAASRVIASTMDRTTASISAPSPRSTRPLSGNIGRSGNNRMPSSRKENKISGCFPHPTQDGSFRSGLIYKARGRTSNWMSFC